MKTIKITLILIGVIVAFFTLKTHAAESTPQKKTETVSMEMYRLLEERLIKEYLAEQRAADTNEESQMKVFDANDKLIYSGPAESEEGKKLALKADLLMELENTIYYGLND